MMQIVTSWNLANLYPSARQAIEKITLRGYNAEEVYLTGELVARLSEKKVPVLSVSDIADTLCPTKRDLYFNKGKNKPKTKTTPRWGRTAGHIVEKFLFRNFEDSSNLRRTNSYRGIRQRLDLFSQSYLASNQSNFRELGKLKIRPEEDPSWLLNLLNLNGRAEFGLGFMHSRLYRRGTKEIDISDVETNITNSLAINPKKPLEIGINIGVRPDFRISRLKIIGDIKTGIGGFQDRYLLTCTGYALANENEHEKSGDINFGIIYFLPTRHNSDYVNPISFANIYIFLIDDRLRHWFIDMRNLSYEIISKDEAPAFPEKSKLKDCGPYCKYFEYCLSQGLPYEGNRASSN